MVETLCTGGIAVHHLRQLAAIPVVEIAAPRYVAPVSADQAVADYGGWGFTDYPICWKRSN